MRWVPPPFGTGSPNPTTRGLEETPYLGSTRLAHLSDEAQLARRRHVATATVPRAARTIAFGRRIPIVPNYHFQRPTAYVEALRPYPTMRPTSASRREDIATGTRRKWGLLPRGE